MANDLLQCSTNGGIFARVNQVLQAEDRDQTRPRGTGIPGILVWMRPNVCMVVKYNVDQSEPPQATFVVWTPVAMVPRCVP
jgi:hypothetical protein